MAVSYARICPINTQVWFYWARLRLFSHEMSNSPRLNGSVLSFKETLHPRFFTAKGHLRPVVRERLLRIAEAYRESLYLPATAKVKDIVFTGSLTTLNYTPSSDVDIHLLVDYSKVAEDQELVADLFGTKRDWWAFSHELSVYGFPVEIFVQDSRDIKTNPSSFYSLIKDAWVKEAPDPPQDLPKEDILALAETWATRAQKALAMPLTPRCEKAIADLQREIKQARQKGISSKAGLYSSQNLAYKVLRNTGILDKLWKKREQLLVTTLTLTEQHAQAMSSKHFIIKESQLPIIKGAMQAQHAFLTECAQLNRQLNEGTVLEEGLADTLTLKLKELMGKGGPALLRKSLLAAVMGGSLLLSHESIAKAAEQAGLDRTQVEQLKQELDKAKPATGDQQKFTQALEQLKQRYVVDGSDAQKTKHYMKFTGNIADVTGIGENGYPLFKTGSESDKQFKAAFVAPKIIKGIVNVRGKDFPGQFVLANGLWYNIGDPAVQAAVPGGSVSGAQAAPSTPSPSPAATPAGGGAKASVDDAGYMFDFSALMTQAQQRYNFKKRANGTVTDPISGQNKTYTSFVEYAYDFVRQSGTGLETYTNDQIDSLFSKGMKVRVPKLPAGQGTAQR